ncbi:MAG TPA: hypothetical protein VEQ34_08415, partial [Pyrinomonadaceae bacterium]|nr:hypothetical protein [Pyrinomonadaceae bacterium]
VSSSGGARRTSVESRISGFGNSFPFIIPLFNSNPKKRTTIFNLKSGFLPNISSLLCFDSLERGFRFLGWLDFIGGSSHFGLGWLSDFFPFRRSNRFR